MKPIQLRANWEEFADVTLKIEGDNSVSMPAHKNILAWQIPYFRNLFSFPSSEGKKEFTLRVEGVEPALTKLFLMSFYGLEVEWTPRQMLQIFKLKSFFSLEFPVEDLYGLTLPAEDFPLLLEVISLAEVPDVRSDPRLRKTVRRNVPPNYDWRGVSEEFKEMITNMKDAKIAESIICRADYRGTRDFNDFFGVVPNAKKNITFAD